MMKNINYNMIVFCLLAFSGCVMKNETMNQNFNTLKDMPIKASHTFKF